MGFWNALSVLAPVAPAMAEAKDIRTQRTQDAQKFAQDQALGQAQLKTRQMAAQLDQQKIRDADQSIFLPNSKPYYKAEVGSMVRDAWSPTKGSITPIPTSDPIPADELKQATKGINDAFSAMGIKAPPSLFAELAYRTYGGTGSYNPGSASGAYKPVPGAAGQPQLAADGKSYVRNMFDPSANEVVQVPMPADFKPVPAKPLSPALRYTNLYAKQILAMQGKGPALTPEEAADFAASKSELTLNGEATARARAVENARYGITNVTDDTGAEVAQTRLNAANAASAGTPYAAGTVGAPTGLDKKNQMLAQSAITQINSMERVLAADPNLTGPGAGQMTKFQKWLGTNSEDSQQFLTAATFLAEHGVGVFGGRNIHSIEDLQKLMGDLKTNPAALKAALEQARTTMAPWATAGGRLPGPRGPSTGGGGGGTGGGQKFKVGDPFMQGGHKFKATAVDKNGKVTAADPVG